MVPFKVYTSFSHLFNSGRGGGKYGLQILKFGHVYAPVKIVKYLSFLKLIPNILILNHAVDVFVMSV